MVFRVSLSIFLLMVSLFKACKSNDQLPTEPISSLSEVALSQLKPGDIIRFRIEGEGLDHLDSSQVFVANSEQRIGLGQLHVDSPTSATIVLQIPEAAPFASGYFELELESAAAVERASSAPSSNYTTEPGTRFFSAPVIEGFLVSDGAPDISNVRFEAKTATSARVRFVVQDLGKIERVGVVIRRTDDDVGSEVLEVDQSSSQSCRQQRTSSTFDCSIPMSLPRRFIGRVELEVFVLNTAGQSARVTSSEAPQMRFVWPQGGKESARHDYDIKDPRWTRLDNGRLALEVSKPSHVNLAVARLTATSESRSLSIDPVAHRCVDAQCHFEFQIPKIRSDEELQFKVSLLDDQGKQTWLPRLPPPPSESLGRSDVVSRIRSIAISKASAKDLQAFQTLNTD